MIEPPPSKSIDKTAIAAEEQSTFVFSRLGWLR